MLFLNVNSVYSCSNLLNEEMVPSLKRFFPKYPPAWSLMLHTPHITQTRDFYTKLIHVAGIALTDTTSSKLKNKLYLTSSKASTTTFILEADHHHHDTAQPHQDGDGRKIHFNYASLPPDIITLPAARFITLLRSENIEVTKTFYQSFFPDWVSERHGDGPLHYSLRLQNFLFEIYPKRIRYPDNLECLILADNLANTMKAIDDFNLPILIQKETQVIMRDPDGRLLQILQNKSWASPPVPFPCKLG
jgi:hypothetical protein